MLHKNAGSRDTQPLDLQISGITQPLPACLPLVWSVVAFPEAGTMLMRSHVEQMHGTVRLALWLLPSNGPIIIKAVPK